jgi:alpha-ketoglutarate-dependent taurine dioxygenase
MGRHPVSETLTSQYDIRPASPLIGAEVEGVDLTQPVAEATAEALREAFWTHKVLVFRNQNLSPLEHVAAVRIFDEPFDHPLWVTRDSDSRLVYPFSYEQGTADRWHIGGTWRNPPFHIESLTYQVVPEVGGHTLWADLQAAYDGLSEPVKQLLESVSAVYSAYPGDGTSNRPAVTETIEQPVIRTHRHTGRKGLFISTGALRLTGVTEAEGQALLPFLLAHASSPNYTVSFGWKPGDFVLWDNLATWHYAVNDYTGPRAYRKVIAG